VQGVYRGAPFSLRPLQGKPQLRGAGSTAAHQNDAADGKGDPDDHPDRSEVHETEQKANNHRRSYDRAGSSNQHEPSAAFDRLSEFLDPSLELLDLLAWREFDLGQWIFGSCHERERQTPRSKAGLPKANLSIHCIFDLWSVGPSFPKSVFIPVFLQC
jgi:hypothetical protein